MLWDHAHLTLERLRLFREVARLGSVAAAARLHSKNPNRISTSLKELGAVFSVELVERDGRGIALTPAGADLARRATDIIQTLEDFLAVSRGQSLQIAIGAGDAALQFLVIPRLAQLPLDQLQFSLSNLRTSDLISGVVDRKLDFAIVHDCPPQSLPAEVRNRSLGTMTFSLFVPKGLERRNEVGNTAWPELAGYPLAAQSKTGSFRRRLDREAHKRGRQLRVHLECESFPMAAQAARCGEFAAILPTIARSSVPADAQMVALPELEACSYRLLLLWHRRTELVRGGGSGQLSIAEVSQRLASLLKIQ